MTINEQYEVFIRQITRRKRSPAKPATIAAYQSYWKNWIQPELGAMKVKSVENGVMKQFVAKLSDKKLSAATITSIMNCVKSIIASAQDENGNELYIRKWNNEFIDSPLVDPKQQHAPVISRESLETALMALPGQFKSLIVLLAGSGLRINEALALKAGKEDNSSYWDSKESKLVIQKALYRGREQSTKTSAGTREVDLCSELNTYLVETFKDTGYLFKNKNGGPMRLSTAYKVCTEAGIPGFHSLRRFYCTHIENAGVPRGLAMFWTGHSGKDIHDRYVKLDKDIQVRKEWAEKAGLGFKFHF